jgi:hypothetical protein
MKVKQNEAIFDVRTIERNLGASRISAEQVEAHLAALEDCEAEAAWTNAQMNVPPDAVYTETLVEDD